MSSSLKADTRFCIYNDIVYVFPGFVYDKVLYTSGS